MLPTERTAFPALESERLILRRFVDFDLIPFLAYLNDPLVARYQTWESYTPQQARDEIEQQRKLAPDVTGQWFTIAIELKETGALIGHLAIKTQEDKQQAEIGFTLAREYQGKGLAFEAVSRLLDYVFIDLEMHRVTAIADCENHPSVSLLDKLGMRREGHFIQNIWFKGKWGDEFLYAILRGEWLRRGAI